MTTRVAWAARARRDLDEVVSYFTERSPRAASLLLASIERSVERVRRYPESGRKVPEFPGSNPALREAVVGHYRLVYALRKGRILILTLFHGRKNFPPELIERMH